jgi:hypothetical protein
VSKEILILIDGVMNQIVKLLPTNGRVYAALHLFSISENQDNFNTYRNIDRNWSREDSIVTSNKSNVFIG